MEPALSPGDVLLLRPVRGGLPRVGSLVVLHDPADARRLLVKRVVSHGDATFSVGSDNPTEGRDSRHFGSLRPTELVGRVAWTWRLGSGR